MSALIPALIKLAMSGRGRGGGGGYGGGGYGGGGGGRGGYGRTPKPQKSDWDWLEENARKQFNRPDGDTDVMTSQARNALSALQAQSAALQKMAAEAGIGLDDLDD